MFQIYIYIHPMGKFQHIQHKVHINNVLLVKIEGPGAGIPSIIIYLLLKGFLQTPLFSSTNQWEKDIYAYHTIPIISATRHSRDPE